MGNGPSWSNLFGPNGIMSRKQAAKPKRAEEVTGFEAVKRRPAEDGGGGLEPVLVSAAEVVADFESRPAPTRYYYYVTYVATLEQPLPLPMFGAMETYMLEEKIEYAGQLIELHERLKQKLAETAQFQHPIHSLVVTGWTFLRKQ
jgi:hypothetical protein